MVDDVRSRTRSSCQTNNPNGEKDQTVNSPSKGGPSRWIQRAYQGTITVIEFTFCTTRIHFETNLGHEGPFLDPSD